MTKHDVLISWLNDAYATEKNLVDVLERHAKHAEDENQIEIKRQYDAHLAQTRRHAEMIEDCLHRLDSDTSAAKNIMAKVSGWMQGIGTATAGDTLVKDCLADYSMEHFEIASYKGLIAAAENVGEIEIADICRDILKDEEEMAKFLEQHIPEITQSHLAHQKAN